MDNTIDTTTNHWEIKSIEPENRKVLVNFSYNGHGLHHSVFVSDITNKDEVVQAVENAYDEYRNRLEEVQGNVPNIPNDIQTLLNSKNIK